MSDNIFPQIPYSIYLGLTYDCNCFCKHCYSRERVASSRRVLNVQHYKDLLIELKTLGALSITYSHGETLLAPFRFEIFKNANELGYRQTVISNGILLDKEQLAKLEEHNIGTVLLSMDHLCEMKHDLNRGREGCYKRLLTAIDILSNSTIYNKGLAVTISKKNEDELENIISFAIEKRLNFISLLTERDKGLADISFDKIIKLLNKYDDLITITTHDIRFNEFKNEEFFLKKSKLAKNIFLNDNECMIGRQLSIDVYGDVRACNFSNKIIGNIFNENITAIWRKVKETQNIYCLR